MVALCFVLVLGSFSPCFSPLSLLTHTSTSSSHASPSSHPSPSADLYATSQVRSRSLLFYSEGSPLEESLVPSEGERLQSEGHSHIQTSRYTADAHSNQTSGPKLDRREIKPEGVLEFVWHSLTPPHMTSHLRPLKSPKMLRIAEISWLHIQLDPNLHLRYSSIIIPFNELWDSAVLPTSSSGILPVCSASSLRCYTWILVLNGPYCWNFGFSALKSWYHLKNPTYQFIFSLNELVESLVYNAWDTIYCKHGQPLNNRCIFIKKFIRSLFSFQDNRQIWTSLSMFMYTEESYHVRTGRKANTDAFCFHSCLHFLSTATEEHYGKSYWEKIRHL